MAVAVASPRETFIPRVHGVFRYVSILRRRFYDVIADAPGRPSLATRLVPDGRSTRLLLFLVHGIKASGAEGTTDGRVFLFPVQYDCWLVFHVHVSV